MYYISFDVDCSVRDEYVNNTKIKLTCQQHDNKTKQLNDSASDQQDNRNIEQNLVDRHPRRIQHPQQRDNHTKTQQHKENTCNTTKTSREITVKSAMNSERILIYFKI